MLYLKRGVSRSLSAAELVPRSGISTAKMKGLC